MELPNPMESPHAGFLRSMQEWVWRRFPTQQLSATDIFYVIQWAQSGIPVSALIEDFEDFLRNRPHFLDDGCRLSKFNPEAHRYIKDSRQHSPSIPHPQEKIIVCDPYLVILDRLTACGRQTQNTLLKEELRKLYATMRSSCMQAQKSEPEWMQRSDSFYRLKAQALTDWEAGLTNLCRTCYEMLSEEERTKLKELDKAERAHVMCLGTEAEAIWRVRRLKEKVAAYFGFEGLLDSI